MVEVRGDDAGDVRAVRARVRHDRHEVPAVVHLFRARAAAAERALEAAPPPPSLTADDVCTAVEAARRDLRRELESVVAKAVRDATRVSENREGDVPLGSLATPEGVAGPSGLVGGADGASAGVRRELAAIKAMLASSPLVSANAGVDSSAARGSVPGSARSRYEGSGGGSRDRTPRMRADVSPSVSARERSAFGSETEEDESGAAVGGVVATDDVAAPPPRAGLKTRTELASSKATPASPPSTPADPPHPASYRDVLDMLDKGMTPPGIRDVDDKPPDPSRAVPRASLEPRRKPWEVKKARTTRDDSNESEEASFTNGESEAFAEKKPFPDLGDGGDGGDGDAAWRPPRAPSMSSEARDVLFGARRKPPFRSNGADASADETKTPFAGFETPGEPSGSLAG